jgi:hypothetical protein
MKYVRRNFLCGLLGEEPSGLDDLNARMIHWSPAPLLQSVITYPPPNSKKTAILGVKRSLGQEWIEKTSQQAPVVC